MANAKEHLLDWLRDAHAMEQQAEQMLKAQAGRLEHYPELKARIEQHLQETLEQQRLVASCIERLGGDNSALKDVAGKVMAFGQAMGGMMMTDEVIKGAMASFAFENLEIATYTTLIGAAEAVGDVETKRVCEQILPEEQAMAAWLMEHLPSVTQQYLQRDEADQTARR
jgi:ferritin-like metal-binding protein YciE